jgi:hypothetical protein
MFSDTLIRDNVVTQCRVEEVDFRGLDYEYKDVVVPIGDVPPRNPRVGNLWFRPSDGRLYIFYFDGDSYQWVSAIPERFKPIRDVYVPIGSEPPINPNDGDMWYRETDGRLYIFYEGSGWVDSNPSGVLYK